MTVERGNQRELFSMPLHIRIMDVEFRNVAQVISPPVDASEVSERITQTQSCSGSSRFFAQFRLRLPRILPAPTLADRLKRTSRREDSILICANSNRRTQPS